MQDDKKQLVMLFGTFDVLHAGHENLFKQAKELGDQIIVVLARDNTVKKIKGELPQNSERERIKNLKEKGFADQVILGDNKDKYKAIKKNKPDIIALGYDQFTFTYRLSKLIIDEKMDTKIHRLTPYNPQIYKSSLIKAKNEQNTQSQSEVHDSIWTSV